MQVISFESHTVYFTILIQSTTHNLLCSAIAWRWRTFAFVTALGSSPVHACFTDIHIGGPFGESKQKSMLPHAWELQ
jgi:hypothetical protein